MRFFRYGLFIALLAGPTTLPAQPIFTEVTAGDLLTNVRAWGASWVDADTDGDLDLFVSNQQDAGGNRLYLNSAGSFALADAGDLTDADVPGSLGATWADYDNDGDLDVYAVGGWLSGVGRLFRNDGSGTFTTVTESPVAPVDSVLGWSAAWGDVDDDGLVDLVVAHPVGFLDADQLNHFFRNTGDDGFARIEGSPITEGFDAYTVPAWSDYDLDGDLDLFIGSGPVSSRDEDNLYANDGTGAFARIETAPIATDTRDGQVMNWIDFDNDGDLDLYVTNFSAKPTNDFYRNDGGTYVQITEGPLVEDTGGFGLGNTWGDLDNDGDLDAFVTTGGSAVDRLYSNNGDGTFTRIESEPLTALAIPTAGATLGDYDGDGDLDLAVTTQTSTQPTRLYRNDADGTNGWLKLDLVGLASNKSAIGAVVRATATIGGSTVTQLREVSAQNTFNGQNALTVHFGLGDAETAEVEVTWPSGLVEKLGVFAARQALVATEGLGVANEGAATPRAALALDTAYPNPFTSTTTIRYIVPAGAVRLVVYDILGRRVRTLADGAHPAGPHTVTWSGTDDAGHALSAGLYVLRLDAAGQSASQRLSIVR